MKPKYNNYRKLDEMKALDPALINEADNGTGTDDSQKGMSEQDLRVESCKMAAKIAKLFDEVSPSDMLEIADTCYKYIKYQQTGAEYDPTFGLDDAEKSGSTDEDEDDNSTPDKEQNDEEDDSEDFDIDMSDVEKDSDDEKKEASNEGGDEIPSDFLDFTI